MNTNALAAPTPISRKLIRHVADYVGPAALFGFGICLYAFQASENLLTFVVWGLLDILIGAVMYKDGAKKDARLPLAYGFICIAVVAIIFKNGMWQWTEIETICAAGASLTFYGLWRKGPKAGIILAVATMVIAGIPMLWATYQFPQTWEWFLWLGAMVSAGASLFLAKPWTRTNIQEWLFAAVSFVFSSIMLILVLRPLVW